MLWIFFLFSLVVSCSKFIHITDINFDPLYKEKSNIHEFCHRGRGSAGKYGQAVNTEVFRNFKYIFSYQVHNNLSLFNCDSPEKLLDFTLDFVKNNFETDIDFIIWTGDNSRHDFDPKLPLNFEESESINEFVLKKYLFPLSSMAMIIPSIGKNDVLVSPNNCLEIGPNRTLESLYKLWKSFIPIPSVYSFLVLGSYFVEVKRNIFVFSINTIFLAKSNPVADCTFKKSPGIKLLRWMDDNFFKIAQINGRIFLSGHIPPLKSTYRPGCLKAYLGLVKKYSTFIHGQFYGHEHSDEFDVQSSKYVNEFSKYSSILKNIPYREVPFGVAFINPSLKPTNNPAFRLYHYNPTVKNGKPLLTDYDQYVLKLKEANRKKNITFEIEYSFRESYKLKSISVSEIYSLQMKILRNEDDFGVIYNKRKIK